MLSDPRAKKEVTEEILSLFDKDNLEAKVFSHIYFWPLKLPSHVLFMQLKEMDKLESAIDEALRLTASSVVVR